jgi:exopolysaccharide biosynthesis WecB/TagA/CpsF family protein
MVSSVSKEYVGPERRWTPRYLTVGPISLPYVDRDKAIATIRRSFVDGHQLCVAFCNSNTLLQALRSPSYAETLSSFLLLNDGIGVDICSYLFKGRPFRDNLNGTDFIPNLLSDTTPGRSVYLLGAEPQWIGSSSQKIAEQFPNCRIVGSHHGYFGRDEVDHVIARINRASPDILLVGLGNPLQEQFIAKYAPRIQARVLIGVGAFLDFSAGKVVRAPEVLRRWRLEWLFRLAQEPARLGRRYTFDIIAFLYAVTRLRVTMRSGNEAEFPAAYRDGRLRPTLREAAIDRSVSLGDASGSEAEFADAPLSPTLQETGIDRPVSLSDA